MKKTRNLRANARGTRESLWQFLFPGNLGLSPSISSQFTLLLPKVAKNHSNSIFLGFKVIQARRCWHS